MTTRERLRTKIAFVNERGTAGRTRYVPAEDKCVHVMRPLICIDRLQVDQMTHDMILVRYPVSSQHVPSNDCMKKYVMASTLTRYIQLKLLRASPREALKQLRQTPLFPAHLIRFEQCLARAENSDIYGAGKGTPLCV